MLEDSYSYLADDIEISKRWDFYKGLLEDQGRECPDLSVLIRDVVNGCIGNASPKEAVLGVIESFIFNASHTLEEMIAIANEGSEARIKELEAELSPEKYKAVKRSYDFMSKLPPIDLSLSLKERIDSVKEKEALEQLTKEELIEIISNLLLQTRLEKRMKLNINDLLRTS